MPTVTSVDPNDPSTGASLGDGDVLNVNNGGTATQTTVGNGGEVIVQNGGTEISATLGDGGVLVVMNGGTAISTTIDAGGTEIVSGGGLTDNTMIAGGLLDLLAGALTSDTLSFEGTGGVLRIEDSSAIPTVAISGFTPGDTIDFSFLTSSSEDQVTVSGDMVTISAGGSIYTLDIEGASSDSFHLGETEDGKLTLVVCYYPGTRIRTAAGDVAVEELKIGDRVVTHKGPLLPIRWIGRNTVSTRFADPLRVLPIRICAGALGDNLPERDLLVSPEHGVLVEDILVQAGALVNGLSIIREHDVPEIFTYYHVECERHALILAEGMPAETFVDNIHRMAFDNWDEHVALCADKTPIAEMDRPRALSRRQVPAAAWDAVMARAVAMSGRDRQKAG